MKKMFAKDACEAKCKTKLVKAVAYMRTSSLCNAGHDRDSLSRQLKAITTYADKQGYVIPSSGKFNDAGVCGTDRIHDRP